MNFTTGAATSTAVQALLRNVTYQDTETTFTVGNRTVQFTGADGDGGTSAAVNKPIHLGKADGVHNGTYIGMFSAPAFNIVNQPIPGPTIPAGSNTIVTTVTGTAASVSLPGIGGTGTGTVIPSTDFSGTAKFNGNSVGSIFGVTLTIGFGGTMTLNAADGVSSSGTWLIVNTPGVTGSGTWSGTRP